MAVANRLMGPFGTNKPFFGDNIIINTRGGSYIQAFSNASDFRRFLAERGGILCSDASLPTSSYATAEVKDNFMGIPQQFAHTKFTQILILLFMLMKSIHY